MSSLSSRIFNPTMFFPQAELLLGQVNHPSSSILLWLITILEKALVVVKDHRSSSSSSSNNRPLFTESTKVNYQLVRVWGELRLLLLLLLSPIPSSPHLTTPRHSAPIHRSLGDDRSGGVTQNGDARDDTRRLIERAAWKGDGGYVCRGGVYGVSVCVSVAHVENAAAQSCVSTFYLVSGEVEEVSRVHFLHIFIQLL
ncbi:hypothetical protein EGR_00529 [Echinococcus granulosus]|uniref:Uncharacterized protein n=1 Tax=Echinococcus granulosus TaxID=6210 RepID=W6VCH1_ECHGR|nr:hypothetical protein EGR_00529 [Echinococcus granulosus]EUB64579.1 hypothetical protein EGR_00529 [Echinococcus granulosus]